MEPQREGTFEYRAVYPIGDTDPDNLPVADVERAVAYYSAMFGFQALGRSDGPPRSVRVGRDAVELGLAENGGDPEQASCYLDVSDVERARRELEAAGVDISPMRVDEHGGSYYRVFFAKDPDGICYCIGQKIGEKEAA
jgi:lactoylglutathione lyase